MMKQFTQLGILAILFVGLSWGSSLAQKGGRKGNRQRNPNPTFETVSHTSDDGQYTFMTVNGDPMNTRIYYLKNGLTVYLTQNPSSPRIYTSIAVRAGSKNDPADATGLAHYLEHMLFKGTDKYGSLDFEKESKLLNEIEELYEKYRSTKDEAERKKLYAEIDRVSGEAAKYAIANEYDKMLAAIGAKGTNAYTSFEQTVYINDIPANQLEKWLKIEGERFRNPILRLFHTELEAVYEEKNISLDSDRREHFFSLFRGIFPVHNYGQQTTIGTIEHLKNPSIKKIKEYYSNFYVPNNMAVCLSGDLDPDATIKMIDQYFGFFQPKDVIPYEVPVEEPLKKVVSIDVTGPEAEAVMIGFRFPGVGDEDTRVMEMIDMILSNSTAGLIDINLNQKQKLLRAFSSPTALKDYSIHTLYGLPKEGQSLEEVRDLLLGELNKIKRGEFEADLLKAIVNNMEIDKMRQYEQNPGRVADFVNAFTTGTDWSDYVQRIPSYRKITKDDVVRIANQYYGENYVISYKRKGERNNVKVVKPEITPVSVNRDAQSDFLKDIVNSEAAPVKPRFLNYDSDIQKQKLNSGVSLNYVKNSENTLFTMYYLLDIGSKNDLELAFAIEYLPFLGTDKYSPEELSQKMYELGLSYDVSVGRDQIYVYLDGINSSFAEGVELFEHILNNAQPDEAALKSLIGRTLKSREDAKLNKNQILYAGMSNWGMYGPENPYNTRLSKEDLEKLDPSALADKIKSLTSFEHKVMYYGPAPIGEVKTILNESHKVPEQLMAAPKGKEYTMLPTDKNKVYFVHYDNMVQAEVMWMSRSVPYDPEMTALTNLFNQYYGGNMSSIVFQTIRESKALAYSTNARYVVPRKKEDYQFLRAYVGTQADKLHDAMGGMFELLEEMPESANLMDGAKAAIKNKIETERITRTSILFNYLTALDRGVDYDLRKDVYEQIDGLGFKDVQEFHRKYIAGQNHTIMVLGSRDKIDVKSLEKYGTVEELTLEQLFGY